MFATSQSDQLSIAEMKAMPAPRGFKHLLEVVLPFQYDFSAVMVFSMLAALRMRIFFRFRDL